MVAHLSAGLANAGGSSATSRAADRLSEAAHEAMADLVGGNAEEIAFGPDTTSLTFAVSRKPRVMIRHLRSTNLLQAGQQRSRMSW